MLKNKFIFIFFTLFVKDAFCVSIRVYPKQIIAKVGDTVIFGCYASEPIESCSFEIQNEPRLNLGPHKIPYHQIKYHGRGLEKGECGVEIVVREKHNGLVTCSVTSKEEPVSSKDYMQLMVAKKPDPPTLAFSRPAKVSGYMENQEFSATCTIKNGRPASNMTWFIGDDQVLDRLTEITQTLSTKDGVYTVDQSLFRTLTSEDNGKELKCITDHMLLKNVNETATLELNVFFGPKPLDEYMENINLIPGKSCKINVTIKSNPQPSIFWLIGDKKIYEDESDDTGRFISTKPKRSLLKGHGYWDCKLNILKVNKEDIKEDFLLVASNLYGERSYKLYVGSGSKSGFEIGIGTVLLITILSFLALILIGTLIAARMSNTWCFERKSARRTGAESSDTESAEHHHQKSSTPKVKMTFTKVFKKKEEKLNADQEEMNTDAVVDEKNVSAAPTDDLETNSKPKTEEGVVYAELNLQNPSAARGLLVRPEEDKTEYAEILHTQNNNK